MGSLYRAGDARHPVRTEPYHGISAQELQNEEQQSLGPLVEIRYSVTPELLQLLQLLISRLSRPTRYLSEFAQRYSCLFAA